MRRASYNSECWMPLTKISRRRAQETCGRCIRAHPGASRDCNSGTERPRTSEQRKYAQGDKTTHTR